MVQRSPVVGRASEEGKLERLIREMREEMKVQGRETREEIGRTREMMEEWEERWRREREEMEDRMESLERKMGKVELKEGRLKRVVERIEAMGTGRAWEGRGDKAGWEREGEEWETRVQKLERKLEMKEREERRRSVIIKRVGREGTAMQRAREILAIVGVRGGIVGAREVGGRMQERKEVMLEVKLESTEAKREVMRNKGRLRGRKERVEDDMTWRERRMQWQLRRIGVEEEVKGRRVRVFYGKIMVDGAMWFWDERREVLRDWRGREGSREGGRRMEGQVERRSEERGRAKN
ncbi:trichohyalin-like [Colletes gigas]|uniref:trichohyalin-like n=1 Tax=Colletes gigas TaxID=935657 RepID=UPI001C9A2EEA|nr:trichohyalin-like [Colletes gigas]